MITIRKSSDRGHFNHGWLESYHTFSFAGYRDPAHVHFRALRVLNDDVVAPGQGFGRHPHENMEILTWVLSGSLAHADSLGHERSLRHGELQRMSAGTGIEHSEYNGSKSEPVHLLQIWLMPEKHETKPVYDQKEFPAEGRKNALQLLASPDAAAGSLSIGQDARMYVGEIEPGKRVSLELKPGRHAWVQVARGAVTINGQALGEGDGAAVSDEAALSISATKDAEVIVFDLG